MNIMDIGRQAGARRVVRVFEGVVSNSLSMDIVQEAGCAVGSKGTGNALPRPRDVYNRITQVAGFVIC